MLTLREGGHFTDRQIRKYFINALAWVGLIVIAILAIRHIALPLVGFFAAAIAVIGFKANVRRWSNWFLGKCGETAVIDMLKALPNDYVLLNDLMLPAGKGNIDHLVIGPNGLFVIETKNYSGDVKCRRDDWYVNGWKIGSLSKQAKRNAMAVKNTLESVFAEQQTKVPFVNALLVFTSGNGRLNINEPTIPVLRSADLPRFIAGYSASAPSLASSELTRTIVYHLHQLQQRPGHLIAGS